MWELLWPPLSLSRCSSPPTGLLSAQDTSAARVPHAGILVDFQDVDLRAVITALAEAGNLNVSYGDIPSRRVTLRLRQAISREDVLPLLRSFAQSNGLQVVQEERFIRLEADATRSGSAVAGAGKKDTNQTEARLYVHRLKHVRAAKLAATLQSIFSSATSPPTAPTTSTRSLSQQLTANQVPPTSPDTAKPTAAGHCAGNHRGSPRSPP